MKRSLQVYHEDWVGWKAASLKERRFSQEAKALVLLRDNEPSDKNYRGGEDRMDFRAIWEVQITRLGHQPAME